MTTAIKYEAHVHKKTGLCFSWLTCRSYARKHDISTITNAPQTHTPVQDMAPKLQSDCVVEIYRRRHCSNTKPKEILFYYADDHNCSEQDVIALGLFTPCTD